MFLGVIDSSSVIVFLLMDIIENFYYAGQALFADQQFKQWRAAMELQEEKQQEKESRKKLEALAREVHELRDRCDKNFKMAGTEESSETKATGRRSSSKLRIPGRLGSSAPTFDNLDDQGSNSNRELVSNTGSFQLGRNVSLQDPERAKKAEKHGLIYRNRAVYIMIVLCMSEFGEILCSYWATVMMAAAYYGPNKDLFTYFHGKSHNEFIQAIKYSLWDFAAELMTFVGVMVIIEYATGLHGFKTFWNYLDITKNGTFFLVVCLWVQQCAFFSFSVTGGSDPSWKFAW
eukprot:g6647.t1